MYPFPLTNPSDASLVAVQDGQRLARTAQVRARQITLLIHLCLMVGNGTCYSVYIGLWRRTKVLCTHDRRCCLRRNSPSHSVSYARWISYLTRGAPIKPLNPAHQPSTAAFLIKQPYEIVRLRSTEVQVGGCGACVPCGLCASLRGPTETGWRRQRTDLDYVCWPRLVAAERGRSQHPSSHWLCATCRRRGYGCARMVDVGTTRV